MRNSPILWQKRKKTNTKKIRLCLWRILRTLYKDSDLQVSGDGKSRRQDGLVISQASLPPKSMEQSRRKKISCRPKLRWESSLETLALMSYVEFWNCINYLNFMTYILILISRKLVDQINWNFACFQFVFVEGSIPSLQAQEPRLQFCPKTGLLPQTQ